MRLLIVGALEGQLSEATKLAMEGGARVAHAASVEMALATLRGGRGADLLLVDVMIDIPALIAGLDAERIHVPVVACGTETNAAAAVNAIRAGAKEYIPLPPDAELIAAIIAAVARESSELLYRDPSMARVVKLADQVATSDASVLITGESGTGKEVMAKYLHARSRRAARPFISINCAAIPEALLESELFGHEKGAFSGAVASRKGKFEQAEGGTLLLDEIGEMPMSLQAKVLRVLEERSFERVGSNTTLHVDVRIVAATNRDLRAAVQAKTFREDLFFRLSVFPLTIPPLRQRPRDIPTLARYFIERFSRDQNKRPQHLSTAAEAALVTHDWPGNVRELQNCVERAVILAEGDTIHPQHLNLGSTGSGQSSTAAPPLDPWLAIDLSGTLAGASRRVLLEVERRKVQEALDASAWDTARAADLLEIPARLLLAKIKEHGLEQPRRSLRT